MGFRNIFGWLKILVMFDKTAKGIQRVQAYCRVIHIWRISKMTPSIFMKSQYESLKEISTNKPRTKSQIHKRLKKYKKRQLGCSTFLVDCR